MSLEGADAEGDGSRAARSPAAAAVGDSRVLHEALALAARGLRVLPLLPRSKKARLPRWPELASSDPLILRQWFERWPDANLGLCTGRGLIGIDLDARAGGIAAWRAFLGRRKFPDEGQTATALTGGGGRHILLRVPVPIAGCTGLIPGVDLKAEGGYLVVEPSTHPETRREYVWLRHPRQGIAPCPAWLLAFLGERGLVRAEAPPPGDRPGPGRAGDGGVLAAELIARFPVFRPGQRNDQMVQAVASLLGRGYDEITIQGAVTRWWEFYYTLGRIRTPPARADLEIGKSIRSIRRSPKFRRAASGIDHRARCAAITLSAEQEQRLGAPVSDLARDRTGSETDRIDGCAVPTHSERVTNTGPRLCQKARERAYVEALIVHATHKHLVEPGPRLIMTNDQLRQIARDRHGLDWHPQQVERLKQKYITRPEKPATRFELLVELARGHRCLGARVGQPSQYRITGLARLLEPADTAPDQPAPGMAG